MSKGQRAFLWAYAALLGTCIVLLVLSEFLSPMTRATILPVAADGFKLTLGAMIGTLSAMIGGTPKL